MLTRTLGSILRGKATTTQVMIASILGGVIGFVPAALSPSLFGQAPALALTVFAFVVVLQANLAVFGLVAAAAKCLSTAILPSCFALGELLLEGPLQGFFAALVNAPFFAWFGLDHYTNCGGLVLGLVFGSAIGLLLAKALVGFRVRMAKVEQDSERYQRFVSKRRNRVLTWIFFGGGHGKKTYAELAAQKGRRIPVRYSGLAFVAIASISLWMLHGLIASSLLRSSVQQGLEEHNGATVDLAAASLDLSAGHVSLSGLAIADRERLDHDAFRARQLSLTIDPGALLARRLVITELTCADARTGAKRNTTARRIELPPLQKVEPEAKKPGQEPKKIEDYIAEAKRWKGRLEQVSRWLSRLSARDEPQAKPCGDAPCGESPGESKRPTGSTSNDASRALLTGIVAQHLRRSAPSVLVRELRFEGVVAESLGGELIDVHAKNLSTQPWLVDAPLEITIKARSGAFAMRLLGGDDKVQVSFERKALGVDEALSQIAWPGKAPMRGGELDFKIAGQVQSSRASGLSLDLPLELVFRETSIQIADLPKTDVERISFPIGLRGSLAGPSIYFKPDEFTQALMAAGKDELAKRLRARAESLLSEHVNVDAAKKIVEEAKKGQVDAARKKAEQELKKALPKSILPKGVVPKGIWPSSGK